MRHNSLEKDSYRFIAPFYSRLVRLIFGSDLKVLKNYFIEAIAKKHVLIIGGGDGLDYMGFRSDLNGDYWELSAAMLTKAKSNLIGSKLQFHLGYFYELRQNDFDEVWLHFVLNTLSDLELEVFLQEVKQVLKSGATIIVTDFFEPVTQTQRLLHWLMIGFFRIATRHSRKDVPDYEKAFEKAGFSKFTEKQKRSGWIRTQIWKVSGN